MDYASIIAAVQGAGGGGQKDSKGPDEDLNAWLQSTFDDDPYVPPGQDIVSGGKGDVGGAYDQYTTKPQPGFWDRLGTAAKELGTGPSARPSRQRMGDLDIPNLPTRGGSGGGEMRLDSFKPYISPFMRPMVSRAFGEDSNLLRLLGLG